MGALVVALQSPEGFELADLTEAVKEALRRKHTVMEGASLCSGAIMVEDECSSPLLIPFGDDELVKAHPGGE